jgi:small-conductance mechanosensitive channel
MGNDQKRRTLTNIRSIIFIILIIAFLVLWATQLYQFILSIAALGAALAIASKELILNFGGSFYRVFAHPFSIGDRIEVNDIRGDVVDVGLMSTQLLEVGPKDYTHQYTGRTISIPNSYFLTYEVSNETDNSHSQNSFVLHVFKIPIKNDTSWKNHMDTVLECANEVCKDFIIPGTHYFERLTRKRQVDMPWIEPRVNLKFSSPSEIFLIVRVTVPTKLKGTIEQAIIKEYLTKIH